MSSSREDIGGLIDAYLDDAMSAEARSAFEARLRTDLQLAQELALQQRIDARLGTLLVPPADLAGVPQRAVAGPGPIPMPRRMRAWIKVAAVLALVTLGAWAALMRPWSGLFGPAPSDVAANVCYAELVKGGLKPLWKCDSDEVFRTYTREKLGTTFTIKPDPAIEVVGWTYASGLLDSSAQVLMCRVEGKPSIVVIGKLSDDRAMHADAGSPVKVHRNVRCGLVMYELTERADATVLNHVMCE